MSTSKLTKEQIAEGIRSSIVAICKVPAESVTLDTPLSSVVTTQRQDVRFSSFLECEYGIHPTNKFWTEHSLETVGQFIDTVFGLQNK